jgi:hypothetical protein
MYREEDAVDVVCGRMRCQSQKIYVFVVAVVFVLLIAEQVCIQSPSIIQVQGERWVCTEQIRPSFRIVITRCHPLAAVGNCTRGTDHVSSLKAMEWSFFFSLSSLSHPDPNYHFALGASSSPSIFNKSSADFAASCWIRWQM